MTRRQIPRSAVSLVTGAALALLGLVCGPAAPAHAATQTFQLWAVTGTTTLPGGQSLPVLGYAGANAPVVRPGGPTLEVNEGDTVEIELHDQVGEPTALLVQGQQMEPDLEGTTNGQSKTYTFTADEPGTYLYEAGLLPNAQHQVAMGLYGALVVHPATTGQAYADASTAYDIDEVLLLSEIDPALNGATNPATFDMRKYAPRYFLVNGRAHPATTPIDAAGGDDVLLRYVNAGMQYHSMGVLGADQRFVALDGSPLADSRQYVAETIGPGQTADALVTAPTDPSVDTQLAVYDASLQLHNSNVSGSGGMLTTIDVPGAPAGPDESGPVTSAVAVSGGSLTATVDDRERGGSTVKAAEYYLDTLDTAHAMTAVGGSFDADHEDVTASVTVPPGEHVFYVRGQDAGDHWGPFSSVLVSGADVGGPTTRSPLLTPNRVNHNSAGVKITATGDDSASGNSNITAAEYFIDTVGAYGGGATMDVNQQAPVASLDATIPAGTVNGLSEGSHVIYIRAKDGQGNWGEPINVNLVVDATGPSTSGLLVEPSPNNGALPYNSSVPAVRVTATSMSDPLTSAVNSPIEAAEGFIDTVGANGSGIRLQASDGVFTDTTEGGYFDIPLATVNALSAGTHQIRVHAKDAAGNWGPITSAPLVIDKTRPTLSAVSASPNPATGSQTVTLTGTAADSSAITRAEWFLGTDPGPGNAAPMTISGSGPFTVTASINAATLGEGSKTLRVRVRDAAGNWSTLGSATLTVRARLFYSTFGNSNPPGVGGAADNADIYEWTGTGHNRSIDMTALYNLPGAANVDGYARVDATHFYLSFADNTTVPGLGTVQDEDVVFRNGGSWQLFFDGTARGLTAAAQDVDAISVDGSTLYFSTVGNTNPPGAGGTADDADVYSWNGSAFSRVWDATANGLPAATNVDGLDRVDATHLYLSFSPPTQTVPGAGTVQDEDVVFFNAGTWLVYFDGSAHGLTSDNLDVDAFDVP
jgi:FtsP/CotA-like multicopper oxidase with cupredoxin domain